jgi:hypothetical protein
MWEMGETDILVRTLSAVTISVRMVSPRSDWRSEDSGGRRCLDAAD